MEIESKIVEVLERVDAEIGLDYRKISVSNTYKYYKHSYIKDAAWPFGVYKRLKTYSDVQIFPDINLKRWFIYGLKLVGIKKTSLSLTTLLGPLFGWFLLPKINYKFSPDIIINKKKGRIVVFIYNSVEAVVKIRPLQSSTQKEVERTRRAKKSIVLGGLVDVPSILKENHSNNSYFVQELIRGKSLVSVPIHIKKNNYTILSKFLFQLYKDNEVQLKETQIQNIEVLSVLKNNYSDTLQQFYGEVLKNCLGLLENKNLCFHGFIHSDIHDGNLILDRENKLWVIDWQNARVDFLIIDLERLPDGTFLFNKLIELFPVWQEEILDFESQRVMQRMHVINSRILRKRISEKKLKERLEEINKLIYN